uniref:Uncharacterized protein n=1 Tax=viral metagenome TaxID=1070528 RepID=A0A6C0C0Z3_9ZZZZ
MEHYVYMYIMLYMDDDTEKINEIESISEESEIPYVYGIYNDVNVQINNVYDVMNKNNEDPFQEDYDKINEVQNTEENSKPYILNYIPTWIYEIYCKIYDGIEEYYGL